VPTKKIKGLWAVGLVSPFLVLSSLPDPDQFFYPKNRSSPLLPIFHHSILPFWWHKQVTIKKPVFLRNFRISET
jgi:hypothetical protein